MENLATATSSRGGEKLSVGGFLYNLKRTGKAHKRWVCVKNYGSGCTAAISTQLDSTELFGGTPHSHPADHASIDVCKAKTNLKTIAKTTNSAGHSRDILVHVLVNLDDYTRASMGNLESETFHSTPNAR